MGPVSERWVSVAEARRAQVRHVRSEALAGLLAGLSSFALVVVWGAPDSAWRAPLGQSLALALGASLSVWVQHVRTRPGQLVGGLSPTGAGLVRFARAVSLAGAAGLALLYLVG